MFVADTKSTNNIFRVFSFFVAATLIFLYGCEPAPPLPPELPKNLPSTSVWRGGEDGGEWQNCEFEGDNLVCRHYYFGLSQYSEQSFELCLDVKPSELPESIPGEFEGSVSTVQGSLKLVPIEPKTIFKNGILDKELTSKSEKNFKNMSDLDCTQRLLLKAR